MGLSCCSAEGVPGAASRGRASSGNRAPQAPAEESGPRGGTGALPRRPPWMAPSPLPPPLEGPPWGTFRAEALEGMQGVSTQSRGEKFPLAQSWPGACPECPLSPWVPFFPPFIQVSHLPFQGHSLLREALPGTPSSPLPWGWHLGPFAPRRQGPPPPFCWQQLPPFYAFNTRTSFGVSTLWTTSSGGGGLGATPAGVRSYLCRLLACSRCASG